MKNIHVSIDHDERPGTYRGVVARRGSEEMRFFTGDPQRDWSAFMLWNECQTEPVVMTSSVDHFVMDEPGWRFVSDDFGRDSLIREDRPSYFADILIREARSHFDPDIFRGPGSLCLTLALAEAGQGRGHILLAYTSPPGLRGRSPFQVFQHSVYKDASGEAWDIDGADARGRCEDVQSTIMCRSGCPQDICWDPVTLAELPRFIQAGRIKAPDPKMVASLRQHIPVFADPGSQEYGPSFP